MLFHAYASFTNTLASYRIGSDHVGLEFTPSFIKANFPLPLDQGKHRAFSLNRIFALQDLLSILACALKYRSLMKP
jgi:hypothetical protein